MLDSEPVNLQTERIDRNGGYLAGRGLLWFRFKREMLRWRALSAGSLEMSCR